MMPALIQCLRPRQWTKNLLVFAGLVFAQRWDDPRAVVNAILGFAIFCILSGAVYILNDLLDVDQDRQHPEKRHRPIASGAVSPRAAAIEALALTVAGLGASFLLLPAGFGWLAVIYLVLTAAYSIWLKHAVILDILILAVGFVLRALAGIEAIRIDPSDPVPVTSYFLLTTLFLALFLAIAKRRNELVVLGEEAANHRQVLGEYSREFLDVALTVATTGTIFSCALWTTEGLGEKGYLMVVTMPFVVYGVFRYLWLVLKRNEGGAPEALLLTDIPLLATVVLWLATVVGVLTILR